MRKQLIAFRTFQQTWFVQTRRCLAAAAVIFFVINGIRTESNAMVREVRFQWDRHQPLPLELTRREWDLDFPEQNSPPRSPSEKLNQFLDSDKADNRRRSRTTPGQ